MCDVSIIDECVNMVEFVNGLLCESFDGVEVGFVELLDFDDFFVVSCGFNFCFCGFVFG